MGDQIGHGGILSSALSRWRISRVLPYLSGNVLDFGCGRGNLADFVPSSRYLGVDFDDESLQIARSSHPQQRFDRCIGTKCIFDSIALLAVIEHIERPLELLDDFDSVLKEGGSILLTTPHPRSDRIHGFGAHLGLFSKEAHEQHVQLYDHESLSRLEAKSKFRIAAFQRFMFGINQLFILKRK
jgi:2-polyprenyl-3-methyl-5-hydroxy-6-metoxy-1,4-benzoquinol methylase